MLCVTSCFRRNRLNPPALYHSIYVLVTSAFPTLRAYIYRQGLVRLATVQYEPPSASNSSKRRMFLTNYAGK